ncbi:MAG: serine/threonine protein kinase [Pirellula sp.]|nr:serine/threonine protein kinase [Pirellula sp.]
MRRCKFRRRHAFLKRQIVVTLTNQFVRSYRLLYQIRSGRFSQVWAAIDDGTGERFALKLLLDDFRKAPEHIQGLQHEFEVGSKLNHSRVLGATDFGQSKLGPYLKMPLCEGLNLRDVIRKSRRALEPWLPSIVEQACEGVAYLNSRGWIHLDLKPDNFMLTPEGGVKLIDFGLARKVPNAWERYFWKRRNTQIQGTRSYLAPEQIRLEPIDLRTDVYGLGCALFHMATGVQPYTASSTNDLLTKHLIYPIPDARVNNPMLTVEFAALIRRMLAKTPAKRPPSVAEVLREVNAIQVMKPTPVATT